LLNYVVDGVFLSCIWCFVAYRTCKLYNDSFWVIGGSKLGFWLREGFENRRFLVCTNDASLKRSYPSLKRAFM